MVGIVPELTDFQGCARTLGMFKEFGDFPRRGYVLQPRVAVLSYPGKGKATAGSPTEQGCGHDNASTDPSDQIPCESLLFIVVMALCTWRPAQPQLGLR